TFTGSAGGGGGVSGWAGLGSASNQASSPDGSGALTMISLPNSATTSHLQSPLPRTRAAWCSGRTCSDTGPSTRTAPPATRDPTPARCGRASPRRGVAPGAQPRAPPRPLAPAIRPCVRAMSSRAPCAPPLVAVTRPVWRLAQRLSRLHTCLGHLTQSNGVVELRRLHELDAELAGSDACRRCADRLRVPVQVPACVVLGHEHAGPPALLVVVRVAGVHAQQQHHISSIVASRASPCGSLPLRFTVGHVSGRPYVGAVNMTSTHSPVRQ